MFVFGYYLPIHKEIENRDFSILLAIARTIQFYPIHKR